MLTLKRVSGLLLSALLLISACGCSFDFVSVESLLRAPKLTGAYAEIERAFEAAVGTSVSLLSPRSGEYRTAFVLLDYDADGNDEAIVFYTQETDNSTVHLHFLDCINGEWISCDDEIGKEKDVYELLLRDLNNDSIPEIIVNFNTKQSNRSMLIYSVSPSDAENMMSVQLMANVQYAAYTCVDLDQDGQTEILYAVSEVSVDTGVSVPYVRILKYVSDFQGTKIDIVSSLSLQNGITSFLSLAADSSGDAVRVYIDCGFHDALNMITEVVTWTADSGYMLLLHKHESAALLKTTRLNGLYTVDIDNDGRMEIPGEYEMPLTVFENNAEGIVPVAIGRNYYHCMQDGTVTPVKALLLDPFGRYAMDLLQLGLYGRICMKFDCITETAFFYIYDSVNAERKELLFSLQFKEESDGLAAYVDVTEDGSTLGFNPDMIVDALSMIEKDVTE